MINKNFPFCGHRVTLSSAKFRFLLNVYRYVQKMDSSYRTIVFWTCYRLCCMSTKPPNRTNITSSPWDFSAKSCCKEGHTQTEIVSNAFLIISFLVIVAEAWMLWIISKAKYTERIIALWTIGNAKLGSTILYIFPLRTWPSQLLHKENAERQILGQLGLESIPLLMQTNHYRNV